MIISGFSMQVESIGLCNRYVCGFFKYGRYSYRFLKVGVLH